MDINLEDPGLYLAALYFQGQYKIYIASHKIPLLW